MLDLRALIGSSFLGGCALAACAFLLFARPLEVAAQSDHMFRSPDAGHGQTADRLRMATEQLLRMPILARPSNEPPVALQLTGISLSGRGRALVSIGGKAAQWISTGETREGVELVEVAKSQATFDSASGIQTLKLGAQAVLPLSPSVVHKSGERPHP